MRGRRAALGCLIGTLGLLAAGSAFAESAPYAAPRDEPTPRPTVVHPSVETTPVAHSGDAADDPAIWVNPDRPGRSRLIGNDKQGALEVYALDGRRVQRITTGNRFWGNVDLRQRVVVNGRRMDVVAAANGALRLYTVTPRLRLSSIAESDTSVPGGVGEGLCMYRGERGAVYVFAIKRSGLVRQLRLVDPDDDGKLAIRQVRRFAVGSEAEGCAADDRNGALYVSEEGVGLWRYGAEPDDGRSRTLVDRVGRRGHLVQDVEGVTVVERGRKGWVIVSAQHVAHPQRSYFAVYSRNGNDYLGAFRVGDGGNRADGCSRTDGLDAYAGRLGRSFPTGVFVCQDDANTRPDPGRQNFKLTRWDRLFPLR